MEIRKAANSGQPGLICAVLLKHQSKEAGKMVETRCETMELEPRKEQESFLKIEGGVRELL